MIINLFNQEQSVTNLTALWGSNTVKNKIIKNKNDSMVTGNLQCLIFGLLILYIEL